jgi:hypothetical protein
MSDLEKSLYRVYKVILPQELNIKEIINNLNNNRAVEYAEIDHQVSID